MTIEQAKAIVERIGRIVCNSGVLNAAEADAYGKAQAVLAQAKKPN